MANKKSTSKYDFKNWREAPYIAESETGNRKKPIYTAKYDDKGVLQIEQVGEEDLYDHIQSFKSQCDILEIMKRYQMGDEAALSKVQGFFIDATGTPNNMADLLNKLNRAETEFWKLPASVREKYGNDFARFICTFEPEIAPVVQEKIQDKKEEVNADEKE